MVEDARPSTRRRRDQVVHAVEAADQGALAAARGPDQGGDLVAVDVQRDRRRPPAIAVVVDVRRRCMLEDRSPRASSRALRNSSRGPHARCRRVGRRLARLATCPSSRSRPQPLARNTSGHLTTSARSVAQPDRDGVHRQQDDQQDDDRGGGEQLNSSCGLRDPVEDLDRQRRELRRDRLGLKVTKIAAPTRISGAVSPIARDSARITPVAMPGIEAGRTCRQIVCHWVAPSASEPSRIEGGTARIASRAAMITTGSTSSAERQRAGERGRARGRAARARGRRARGCRR